MAENITELTDANFDAEVLESGLPVLIDFWAAWCAPCHMISPIVEELAGQYAGKIKVCKMDVDSNQAIPVRYSIMSIPTLLFFNGGNVVEQIIGVRPKSDIQRALENTIAMK